MTSKQADLDHDSLPMKKTDFISWDSDVRDSEGLIRVPPAQELAAEMAAMLRRNRWTSNFGAKAQNGAVVIFDSSESFDVVAVVARRGKQVIFDSFPQEPEGRVNEGIRNALDQAMKSFRPWSQSNSRPIFASSKVSPATKLRTELVRLAHQKPELRAHLLPLLKEDKSSR